MSAYCPKEFLSEVDRHLSATYGQRTFRKLSDNALFFRGYSLEFDEGEVEVGENNVASIRAKLVLPADREKLDRPTFGSLAQLVHFPDGGLNALNIRSQDVKKHGKYVERGVIEGYTTEEEKERLRGLPLNGEAIIDYPILGFPSHISRFEGAWWVMGGKPLFKFIENTTPHFHKR